MPSENLDYAFFVFLSNPQATRNRIAGGTTKNQKIRKFTNQSPFSMTQISSRTNMVAMVIIPPMSSHRQAINNPKIATPHKLNKNQSEAGTGSVAYGSGIKILSKATIKTRMLQMRAIQRIIFTEREAAFTLLMGYLLWAKVNNTCHY